MSRKSLIRILISAVLLSVAVPTFATAEYVEANAIGAYDIVDTQVGVQVTVRTSSGAYDLARISLLEGDGSVANSTAILSFEIRESDGTVSARYSLADEILLKIADSKTYPPEEIAEIGETLGGTLESLGTSDFFVLKLGEASISSVTSALNSAAEHPSVEFAEPNWVQFSQANKTNRASVIPSDPRFNQMWHLDNTGQNGGVVDADINAPEAWNIETGADDVVISVIDTGIDYTHPDLAANIWTNPLETGIDSQGNDKRTNQVDDDGNGFVDDWRGWDFSYNDNDPFDEQGHGTHVAGTILAVSNNGVGVTGVAWSGRVIPIQFLNKFGSGSTADAIRAIDYSKQTPAFASNNSWGGGGYSQLLKEAISSGDSLFLAAAGNSSTNNDVTPHYPSSYDVNKILAVASTDRRDQLSSFSNYGANSVDIAAPGSEILSTIPGGGYGEKSGTSMATPVVSGVAVLVKSKFPSATWEEIKQRILAKASTLPQLNGVVASGARVNAEKAVTDTYSADVPIGVVVSYFGNVGNLPDNWALCDGRQVFDQDSPFAGQVLPDLRGRFVMGVDGSFSLGDEGGIAQSPPHAHQAGLSTNNVWFPRESGNGYAHAYNPATRAGAFDTEKRNITAPDGASNPYDTHGHMNGTAYVHGSTAGGGVHDNRPPFIALQYIIRIK